MQFWLLTMSVGFGVISTQLWNLSQQLERQHKELMGRIFEAAAMLETEQQRHRRVHGRY